MNWRRIATLAITLLLSQVVIGFAEGVAATPDQAQTQFLLSTLLSFIAAGFIFWFFANRQKHRPFLHAGLALVVMAVLSLALAAVVFTWLGGNLHIVFLAAEWLTLAAALVIGTYFGSRSRGRSGASAADA